MAVKREKKVGDSRGDIGAKRFVLTPFWFSRKEQLNLPLLIQGLKLSNSKPDGRVSAFHCFVKYMPPMAFSHRPHSDKWLFQLFLNSGLTPHDQMTWDIPGIKGV